MMGGMLAGVMGGGMLKDMSKGMSKEMPEGIGGGTPSHSKPANAETKKDPKLTLLAEGANLLCRSVA